MYTKVLALFTLLTIVRSHDVIVGLKTDGTKFFDENRQANPALWRQMDNVTIKAPENEVIRRIVITDLRPDKDGDAKVVEGGEGHKNVTIELKSPTVLRGYEFHIEAYAAPDDQSPLSQDQQTTENTLSDATKTTAQGQTNFDTTSKLPEFTTDNGVPVVIGQDEDNKDSSEREGRSAKNEEKISTEATTDITSTVKSDISTTPGTQITETTEKVTEKSSEKGDSNENKQNSPVPPISLNKDFKSNTEVPTVTIREITKPQDQPRHIRDTEAKQTENSAEKKLDTTPATDLLKSTTDTSTTETSDVKPVEEKSEDKEDSSTTPKTHTFETRKYTSFIPSKVPNVAGPITLKDEKLRNAREAGEDQKASESLSTTTEFGESTTANIKDVETTTNEDCVTPESEEQINVNNPVNVGKESPDAPNKVPLYVNTRQWEQRFNDPRMQSDNNKQSPDDVRVFPLPRDQQDKDSETLGNDYKNSPDHMENRNPKIRGIASFKQQNTPVISTQ